MKFWRNYDRGSGKNPHPTLKPVVVTPAAQRDIERIADWYENKREGLGLQFSDRVQEAVDRIRLNPEGYAPAFKNARESAASEIFGLQSVVSDSR